MARRDGEQFRGQIVEHYLSCGLAYLEAGEFEKGRTNFSSAEALQPEAMEPALFQGISDYMVGNPEKAEKKFRKIHGFRDIPLLVSSMRKEVDAQSHVA